MNNHRTQVRQLQRSKSMCSLDSIADTRMSNKTSLYGYRSFSRTISESSVEIYVVNDTDYEDTSDDVPVGDSGLGYKVNDDKTLAIFEKKVDRLNDLFIDQTKLLALIKDDISTTKVYLEKAKQDHTAIFTEILKNVLTQREDSIKLKKTDYNEYGDVQEVNNRAKMLLDAIEHRQTPSLDKEMKEVLTSFLQSNELKDYVVSATVESLKDIIANTISNDFSNIYQPLLERSQRRLLKHITNVLEDAFVDLEENSAAYSKRAYRTSRSIHFTLGHHRRLLQSAADTVKNVISNLKCTIKEVLEQELQQWRKKALKVISQTVLECASEKAWCLTPPPSLDYVPPSPSQPADPERSIIDQLMSVAEINKQIADGDVNGSFEKALSAGDLSLVMAACRGADPDTVFAPCRLAQHVLLSLVQQLATDMVHDTQLKCRYLEEAIINLNPADAATRAHLPLVVTDVRKHLINFLVSYPSHIANRRITLIVMAIGNLYK